MRRVLCANWQLYVQSSYVWYHQVSNIALTSQCSVHTFQIQIYYECCLTFSIVERRVSLVFVGAITKDQFVETSIVVGEWCRAVGQGRAHVHTATGVKSEDAWGAAEVHRFLLKLLANWRWRKKICSWCGLFLQFLGNSSKLCTLARLIFGNIGSIVWNLTSHSYDRLPDSYDWFCRDLVHVLWFYRDPMGFQTSTRSS